MFRSCLPLLAALPASGAFTHADCSYDADVAPVALLQSELHLMQAWHSLKHEECGHLMYGSAGDPDTMSNNNGKYHSHRDDFNRSISQVMSEHPGVDGYCYFNAAAMYISYEEEHNYPQDCAGGILGLRGADYQGLNSGEFVTFHWEGQPVSTHADSSHYLYDDLYALSLGFLQNQGLETSLMTNNSAWVDLSRQQCEQIQVQYQFTDDDLILNDLLDANLPIMAKCYCAAGVPLPSSMNVPYVAEKAEYISPTDCTSITQREFALHHYMKCALGYKNSAADMAYLHGRACLLEGGTRIGHETECPWSPEGV